ncbi:hypothetical protein SLEP1_g50950 [Rubroshorea leprosula]|uniref:Uncharacterized protein n=1 Tax=Rubroshorea leprosula TaxID=152421 RepID=A0AAV5M3S6_9ROSI|nr:hypothetical protein SLEP1_g50950 [Rubroshorea leprosula]
MEVAKRSKRPNKRDPLLGNVNGNYSLAIHMKSN